MTPVELPGRLLFLSDDPRKVEAQLAGEDLQPAQAAPLRDDVSTDEMTPQTACLLFDERLGREVLIGFKAGDRRPIARDAIRRGGFSVIVAGKRYGKGSSREHSPLAHVSAGIRLIVAESFERIFRQNCDNLGLFTSTDMGLAGRIRRGEVVAIEELVRDRDSLAAALLRAGGLLRYASKRGFAGPAGAAVARAAGPQTLVEKILARHAADPAHPLKAGEGGFVRADWRFCHEYFTGMVAHLLHANFGRPVPLHDTQTILLFEDHLTLAHRSPVHVQGGLLPGVKDLSHAHREFAAEYGIRRHVDRAAHALVAVDLVERLFQIVDDRRNGDGLGAEPRGARRARSAQLMRDALIHALELAVQRLVRRISRARVELGEQRAHRRQRRFQAMREVVEGIAIAR